MIARARRIWPRDQAGVHVLPQRISAGRCRPGEVDFPEQMPARHRLPALSRAGPRACRGGEVRPCRSGACCGRRSSILRRLGRERQLEVCMQCHLETTSHEPNEQRAFDRPIFSYRPGQPMADYKLYFVPAGNEKHAGSGTDDPLRSRTRLTGCACPHASATAR